MLVMVAVDIGQRGDGARRVADANVDADQRVRRRHVAGAVGPARQRDGGAIGGDIERGGDYRVVGRDNLDGIDGDADVIVFVILDYGIENICTMTQYWPTAWGMRAWKVWLNWLPTGKPPLSVYWPMSTPSARTGSGER